MKRIPTLLTICLTTILFISGCSQNTPSSSDMINDIPTGQVTDPAPDSDQPATSFTNDIPPQPGMLRSRLTNEWVDEEVVNTRPIAIMVPNLKTASQYGLSSASVLYECVVEGSQTRLMGIWDDWRNMDKIGNIRSCRDYYAYWAFEWDAFFIHFGGPFYADDILGRSDTQSINCLRYSGGSYRDMAKNSTDNAFTSTEMITQAIDHFGYSSAYRDGYADEHHYQFAAPTDPNNLTQYDSVITAGTVDLSPAYPLTNCYFIYNTTTGLYERFQHLPGEEDAPHLDLANEQQLTFKNIIVQSTYYEQRDQKGYLAFQCHDTSRDGWFFTNGKGIHITWEKTSDYGATRYYDDDGNEIELNTGKTMVCIIEDGDNFIVDRQKL